VTSDYPEWFYYPASRPPAGWVADFIRVVAEARSGIDSRVVDGLASDKVLAALAGGLKSLGFVIEESKLAKSKIRRPVLFGDRGIERVAYQVDGWHEGHGIVLEIEAGRGARGNAVYRDIIRSSLIVDANYFALGVMLAYRHLSKGQLVSVPSYGDAKSVLDASERPNDTSVRRCAPVRLLA